MVWIDVDFLFCTGILTPSDEFQYWAELSESAEKNSLRERAAYFTEQFKPIQKVPVLANYYVHFIYSCILIFT